MQCGPVASNPVHSLPWIHQLPTDMALLTATHTLDTNTCTRLSCRRPAVSNAIIFWIYAPGLILYVLKKPKNQTFGFHEWFHSSVIAGHIASMIFDLRNIVSPCAAGLCGL
mmetsp:Transcript_1488/g.4204  ORF Transcript_1488/g.4204 Transcript_1488/m.4204 type:complete len:111 (+) Transcript_1488:163-495(+)